MESVRVESSFASVPETAAELRVSVWTVRGWLRDGKLPKTKAGGRVLIARSDIRDFLQVTGVKQASVQQDSGAIVAA
jgi:excisionase family DNA binding protein